MLRITAEMFAKRGATTKKTVKMSKQASKMANKLAASNNIPAAPKTTKKEMAGLVTKTVDDYLKFFSDGIANQQASNKVKRPNNALLQLFVNKQHQKSKMPGYFSKIDKQVSGYELGYADLVKEHTSHTKVNTYFVPPKTSFGLYYNESTINAIKATENINKQSEKLNKTEVGTVYKKAIETFQNPPAKSLFAHQKTVADQVFDKINNQYKSEMAMVALESDLKSVKAPKNPFWRWYADNKEDLTREGTNLRLKGIQISHHARSKWNNLPAVSKTKYEKEHVVDMIVYEAQKEENKLRKIAAGGNRVQKKPLATLYQLQERAKLPAKVFNNYDEKKQYDTENIQKFRAAFKNLSKVQLAELEKAREQEFLQRQAKVHQFRKEMNL